MVLPEQLPAMPLSAGVWITELTLSGTPSLVTGTSPLSCQILNNRLYMSPHSHMKLLRTVSCDVNKKRPLDAIKLNKNKKIISFQVVVLKMICL